MGYKAFTGVPGTLAWDAKTVNPYVGIGGILNSIDASANAIFDPIAEMNKQNYDRGVANKTGAILADLAEGRLTSLEGINLDGTNPAVIAKALTTMNNNKSIDTYRKGIVANSAQKITNAQTEADRKRKVKEVSDVALGNYYATLGDTTPIDVANVDPIVESNPSVKEVVDNIYPTIAPVVTDEVVVEPTATTTTTPVVTEVVGAPTKKNAVTTSTITVDGISHEVTEDRKQRIVNQRETKATLKAMEQRKYDETKTFIKDNPSMAKEAMTSFKAWRKDYRANNVVGSNLTAGEKQLILDSAERDNAAYYNGVGYDSKGKPFYKKDTGAIVDPTTGEVTVEGKTVSERDRGHMQEARVKLNADLKAITGKELNADIDDTTIYGLDEMIKNPKKYSVDEKYIPDLKRTRKFALTELKKQESYMYQDYGSEANQKGQKEAATAVRESQGLIDLNNKIQTDIADGSFSTGLIDTTVQKFSKYVPKLGETLGYSKTEMNKFIENTTQIGGRLVQYVKEISGAAVTDKERKAIYDIMTGGEYANEEQMATALAQWSRDVVDRRTRGIDDNLFPASKYGSKQVKIPEANTLVQKNGKTYKRLSDGNYQEVE